MQTILVEVKNSTGLRILQDLEQASIIRLVPQHKEQALKLSDRLRGAIPKETAIKMQSELDKMRNE